MHMHSTCSCHNRTAVHRESQSEPATSGGLGMSESAISGCAELIRDTE